MRTLVADLYISTARIARSPTAELLFYFRRGAMLSTFREIGEI
jgi:hypothetical protein